MSVARNPVFIRWLALNIRAVDDLTARREENGKQLLAPSARHCLQELAELSKKLGAAHSASILRQ
jgi:hypothetical protein